MTGPTIRVAAASDARAIRDIYAPYVENTPITFEVTPPSVAEFRTHIRETSEEYPWLVCEADDEVLGYACAGPIREYGAYRWAVESTVYVAESAQGEGIGSALYESLLSVLALQNYVDVHALVTLPNPASVAVHEAFGFECETVFERLGYKNGAWHDVSWWRLALDERAGEPDPLLTMSEAKERTEWTAALESGAARLED